MLPVTLTVHLLHVMLRQLDALVLPALPTCGLDYHEQAEQWSVVTCMSSLFDISC